MKILDLFSGAVGAAMGYHLAFPHAEIIGVDINPQLRYPFTFVQADAMTYPLEGFDFIHASPVCKAHTKTGWAYHFNYHAGAGVGDCDGYRLDDRPRARAGDPAGVHALHRRAVRHNTRAGRVTYATVSHQWGTLKGSHRCAPHCANSRGTDQRKVGSPDGFR